MSKKIKIKLKDRPNLYELFRSYMKNKSKESKKNKNLSACPSFYDFTREELIEMGLYDGENYDDYADFVFPYYNPKKKDKKKSNKGDYYFGDITLGNEGRKKKHKRNKKKTNEYPSITIPYNGEEGEDVDDNITIHYYPDYTNLSGKITFKSLKAFDGFCLENGFDVPQEVSEDIAYTPCSHVCLDPVLRECGIYTIIQGYTYTSMYNQCVVNSRSIFD